MNMFVVAILINWDLIAMGARAEVCQLRMCFEAGWCSMWAITGRLPDGSRGALAEAEESPWNKGSQRRPSSC